MRREMRLTEAGVRRLRPGRTEYIVWDSRVSGLGVRVRPTGHRSYVCHGYTNGAAARLTIGSINLKTIEEARKEILALRNGTHPRSVEDRKDRPAVPVFRDFAATEWRQMLTNRSRQSSSAYYDRILKGQLLPAFGRLRLDRIRRIEVERWFDTYSQRAPGGANKALALLRQIMNAAVAAGHVASNSAKGIRANPRTKLTRFLSTEEIERLHRVLDRLVEENPFRQVQADIIRLLLLTGCRRGEILTLRWAEVDGNMLRLTQTKTGPRQIWLSEVARTILGRQPRTGSTYVFPSRFDPTRPRSINLGVWDRARREADIRDVRLHDLRHTVASQAVARGVALPTVARMLGHTDPTMTLRYAHVSDRDAEIAAERIGRLIANTMETGEAIVG